MKSGTITQQQGRMSLSRLKALEKTTYPLFNEKIEANNQVPQNGDEVMIVEQ
jgi:hypothetical protein